MEPPLTDIFYSGHLIIEDKLLQPELNLHYVYTLKLSELRTPCYSVKWTDLVVPLVPRLYKIYLIMRTLAGLSYKMVQHRRLIHQLDIILTLVCMF